MTAFTQERIYEGRHQHHEGSDQWRIRGLINKTHIHTPGYRPRHAKEDA